MINIMDIRQLLLYTKDRLDFYSSQHSELNLQLPPNLKLNNADYQSKLNEEMYGDRNDDDLYNMQPREGSYDEILRETILNAPISGQKPINQVVSQFLLNDIDSPYGNQMIELNEAMQKDFMCELTENDLVLMA